MDYLINENQQELDYDLVKVTQKHSREQQILNDIITGAGKTTPQSVIQKSCQKEEIPVLGETYVNKNKNLASKIKKGLVVAGLLLVTSTTIHWGNIEEDASTVRHEVSQEVTLQNPIGGQFYQKSIYDDQFIEFIQDMSNLELANWVNDIKDEMKEAGLETKDISQVVKEMQKDFLEKNKGEKK